MLSGEQPFLAVTGFLQNIPRHDRYRHLAHSALHLFNIMDEKRLKAIRRLYQCTASEPGLDLSALIPGERYTQIYTYTHANSNFLTPPDDYEHHYAHARKLPQAVLVSNFVFEGTDASASDKMVMIRMSHVDIYGSTHEPDMERFRNYLAMSGNNFLAPRRVIGTDVRLFRRGDIFSRAKLE